MLLCYYDNHIKNFANIRWRNWTKCIKWTSKRP